MTSQARIDANRRNAQKSTGPRTSRGKARSSRNGRRHGLAAGTIRLTAAEARAFGTTMTRWVAACRPADDAEREAIGRAVLATVMLHRITRAEAEAIRVSGEWLPDAAVKLVLRYQPKWRRALHEAIEELRGLQERRSERATDAQDEPNENSTQTRADAKVATQPSRPAMPAPGPPRAGSSVGSPAVETSRPEARSRPGGASANAQDEPNARCPALPGRRGSGGASVDAQDEPNAVVTQGRGFKQDEPTPPRFREGRAPADPGARHRPDGRRDAPNEPKAGSAQVRASSARRRIGGVKLKRVLAEWRRGR